MSLRFKNLKCPIACVAAAGERNLIPVREPEESIKIVSRLVQLAVSF